MPQRSLLATQRPGAPLGKAPRLPYPMEIMRRVLLFVLLPGLLACRPAGGGSEACVALSGPEITAAFADVVDEAVVQDGRGGTARNHWCSDGRFTSRWEGSGGGGALAGTWWVEGDLRCVRADGELPDGEGARRCVPIRRCGTRFVSLNEAGRDHGWHVLTKRPCSSIDPPSTRDAMRDAGQG